MRAVAAVVCAFALFSLAQATVFTYVTYLNSEQNNPAFSSNAFGGAVCTLNDAGTGYLNCDISLNGLSAAPTAMHIHGPSTKIGDAVGVIVTFNLNSTYLTSMTCPNAPTSPIPGYCAKFTQAFADATATYSTLASALSNGNAYINVHTTAAANGEIRGQLYPETDIFVADLTVAQATAAGQIVTTPYANATGRGSITLNAATGAYTGKVWYWNLITAPTAAHIHDGYPKVGGGVVIAITPTAGFNAAYGMYDISGTFTQAQIAALRDGRYYFNIHTGANTAGEIRGQLWRTMSGKADLAAGSYKTACTSHTVSGNTYYTEQCFTIDATGQTWTSGGVFFTSDCNSLLSSSAWNKNFTLASQGVNQPVNVPGARNDRAIFRYWGADYVAVSPDALDNSGCGSCPGYSTSGFVKSHIERKSCPTTCPLLADEYGALYFDTANNLKSTDLSTVQATGWGSISTPITLTTNQFSPTSSCKNYVDAFGKSAASMAAPSVLVAALMALLALIRL